MPTREVDISHNQPRNILFFFGIIVLDLLTSNVCDVSEHLPWNRRISSIRCFTYTQGSQRAYPEIRPHPGF